MLRKLGCLLVALCLLWAGPTVAQNAGQVVEVRQSAQVVSGGTVTTLAVGSQIVSGDEIRTGAGGLVQITFPDETKIVVGPGSTLRIDETLFRNNGTARRFGTTALGGSFRFISGKSNKDVYKLATPLATMGIRGTAFDFTVSRNRGTDLLVFDGLVRFCARDRRCALAPGGCQAVTVLQDGTFTQPETPAEKRELLRRSFPLLADQDALLPQFRTSTAGCTAVTLIALPGPRDDNERRPTPPGERDNPADGPSDSGGGGGNPAD